MLILRDLKTAVKKIKKGILDGKISNVLAGSGR